ncbi:hypothetical protein GCM10009868_12340 [Terrabacter aerolatus]|uniref:Excreted virulence factor EspC (Type VII ESX diderm) n=1 Tax=Terrabacter aerolatus TaxID=422442 RepID=A0A512CYJ7_9MICO|nr:hypothetical protein [Terrabacter aerolatus]GEO29090.1 hypothetical protein TAE01_09000 [Terrabacter aerolatus]
MRYDVDTATLRDDVASMTEAVLRVQGLGVAGELEPIAGALPGARVAPGLREISALWDARLSATRRELQQLGRSLEAAADAYDAVDDRVRDSVGRSSGASR